MAWHGVSHYLGAKASQGVLRNRGEMRKSSLCFCLGTAALFGPGPSGAKASACATEPKSRALETDASRLNRRLHGGCDALGARTPHSPSVKELFDSAGCQLSPP